MFRPHRPTNWREQTPLVAVWVLVLAAAAASGLILNSVTFSDADAFAQAGAIMLSNHWQHTYSDPWLQAGPFEMLICLLGRTLGGALPGEAGAPDMIGAAALPGVAAAGGGPGRKPPPILARGGLRVGGLRPRGETGAPSRAFYRPLWSRC